MSWLNYHHLQYFWAVVRAGSIAAASRQLHVGRPAVSAQLKILEAALGSPLFERRGRHLDLTETGKLVHEYADQIFRLGGELEGVLRGGVKALRPSIRVGVADVMMKSAAFQILEPVLTDPQQVTLRCSEGPPNQLFAALAVHDLDLVLADVPPMPQLGLRLRSHLVLESQVGLFAAEDLAKSLKGPFPGCLRGASMLLPSRSSAIRHSLETWFEDHDLHFHLQGEFEDSALLKHFGGAGHGVFPAPLIVREELEMRFGARLLGEVSGLVQAYYAVTPERRHPHPLVHSLLSETRSGATPASGS